MPAPATLVSTRAGPRNLLVASSERRPGAHIETLEALARLLSGEIAGLLRAESKVDALELGPRHLHDSGVHGERHALGDRRVSA